MSFNPALIRFSHDKIMPKMNIHKDKMLWYNTWCCIRASYERR